MKPMLWNQELFIQAAQFSAIAHAFQKVKDSGANYVLHVSLVVAEVLAAWSSQPDFDIDLALTSAWLHDTIEDTETHPDTVRTLFGEQVLVCVLALSKNKKLQKTEQMPDSINRILKAPREAAIVKMADRITNLQKPPSFWNKEKIKQYCLEARLIHSSLKEAHLPLAERLHKKIEEYELYWKDWKDWKIEKKLN